MAMDDLLARQMPQAVVAEQAVIGSMLIDPSCIPEVIELLRPEDFYAEENRRIFETIFSMFTDSLRIDAVTVLNELKINGTEASPWCDPTIREIPSQTVPFFFSDLP